MFAIHWMSLEQLAVLRGEFAKLTESGEWAIPPWLVAAQDTYFRLGERPEGCRGLMMAEVRKDK